MRFDPALAAHTAFLKAIEHELGDVRDDVIEAEAVFSSSAGPAAAAAYDRLQEIGARHPTARAFQEFLIYSAWQQFAEEMTPRCLRRGLALCEQYLTTWGTTDPAGQQVLELQASFRHAVGTEETEDDEYDRDTFKGGD